MIDYSKRIKYADDCGPCQLCGEPWCDDCELHYADCNCPGPNTPTKETSMDYTTDAAGADDIRCNDTDDMFDTAHPEWVGMPEFVMNKQEPFSKLIIRFANDEDLQDFAEMIGQKLNSKTKSIWHPKLVRGINSNKCWIDSDE